MPNVLIRDVPLSDLEQLRVAAAEQGRSVQSYLRNALQSQAAYVRRQGAIARAAHRLSGRPEVPEVERSAVLDAIAAAQVERAEHLSAYQRDR